MEIETQYYIIAPVQVGIHNEIRSSYEHTIVLHILVYWGRLWIHWKRCYPNWMVNIQMFVPLILTWVILKKLDL